MKKEGKLVQCYKCGYIWRYNGKNPDKATCPNRGCNTSVVFKPKYPFKKILAYEKLENKT